MRYRPCAARSRVRSRAPSNLPAIDLPVTPFLRLARQLAVGVPAVLLGGALIGQHAFGLYPCEMCLWQRYPHVAAIVLATLAYFASGKRALVGAAGLALLITGAIGAFHAGVEYGWWEGLTECATVVGTGGSAIDAITSAPLVRCDKAQWEFLGISLAGWNFLVSSAAGIAVLSLLMKDIRR